MNFRTMNLRRWLRALAALWLMTFALGCASGPKLVAHGFSFDGLKDKWATSVDLLAYAYGDGYHMVREDLDTPSTSLFAGKPGLPSGNSVYGPMPVGEFLYVRWRLKASGEVIEQRVELRDRLPKDMREHELCFVIDGRQLYVYVVTPVSQKPWGKAPTNRSWLSAYSVAYEVFPSLQKP